MTCFAATLLVSLLRLRGPPFAKWSRTAISFEGALNPPVVFISYSHDSQAHKLWVLNLATRLRQSGIDAILDQWDIGPGSDVPHFMEQSLARSARVVMICTERYVEKANGGVGGVGYEKMIVTADLLKQIGSNRVIPVLRQDGTSHLPTFLSSKLYVDLSSDDHFETGMDQLLRELLGAPLFLKPPLGSEPLSTASDSPTPASPTPVAQFLRALSVVYEQSSEAGVVRTESVRHQMGGSKLFFDHALDQAMGLKYVGCGPDKQILWVKEVGRAAMIKLGIGQGRS